MFTNQVPRPVDSLDPPSWPRTAQQGERSRRKTWSRSRSEVFVPYSGFPVVTAAPSKSSELEERPGHGHDPSFCAL
jgi:hypothetical protein